ncbi:MAG: hypothetical protein ACUVXI_16195 [bacterium]
MKWLKGQIVPNDIVPSPSPTRRRLMVSYVVPPDDPVYPYTYSRSFAYDNALGVIALTMAGEYRDAEYILGAMRRLMRGDGSFWFTYNTHNDWPNEGDYEGAILRTGSIAWVGYAATFYLNARLREDRGFLDKDPLAKGFLEMAEAIARFILGRQILDPSDRRYGLVTGGWASYVLKLSDETGKPIEEYQKSDVSWISMEHNIDIYFFLRDLGRLERKREYGEAAELVKKGLLGLWSEEYGQLFRGIGEGRVVDTALPLDGASWGSMFLFSIGEDKRARRCLSAIEERFASQSDGARGYKPYSSGTVYEDERVNAYYYPDNPEMGWDDVDMVWVEGSLGVALAYIKAGNPRRALEIIESAMALRSGGGFRYSTLNIPYQFSDDLSVASTAWFVIAVEALRDRAANAAFWGR